MSYQIDFSAAAAAAENVYVCSYMADDKTVASGYSVDFETSGTPGSLTAPAPVKVTEVGGSFVVPTIQLKQINGAFVSQTPSLHEIEASALMRDIAPLPEQYWGATDFIPTSEPIASYSNEVLADSPIAYYEFDDATKGDLDTMADSSGNSNDGRYRSGCSTVTGLVSDGGDALELTGSTGHRAEILDAAWMDISGDLSVEAWVNPDSVSGIQDVVARWELSDVLMFILGFNGTVPRFLIGNSGGTTALVEGTTTAAAGTTYHLVGTYNSTTGVATLYVNGISEDTATLTGGGSLDTGDSRIGVGARIDNTAGSQELDGTVDEVAIYDTALSPTRVAAHYNAAYPYRAAVLADGPEVFLQLNETTGTTATDISGNGNDGIYAAGVTLGEPGLINYGTGVRPGNANVNQVAIHHATLDMNVESGSPFTIETWVQLDDQTVDALQTIADKTQLSPNSNNEWFLAWENRSSQGSPQRLRFAFENSANVAQNLEGNGLDLTSAPAHIVIAYTGTDLTMYVNGNVIATMNTTFKVGSNTGQCTIGGSSVGTAFRVQGVIDEFAFYRSELSHARVAAHYDAAFAGASFTPSDVTGLLAWYDATAITGLNDGDTVTTWSDLSSNGIDLTGITSPKYRAAGLNGKASVELKSNAFLNGPDTTSHGLTAEYFIIASASFDTVGGGQRTVLSKQYTEYEMFESGSKLGAYRGGASPGLYIPAGGATLSTGTPYVLATQYTNSTLSTRLNGAEEANIGNTLTVTPANNFHIGARPNQGYFMDGQVGEVIIVHNPSAEDIASLEQYMTDKWLP